MARTTPHTSRHCASAWDGNKAFTAEFAKLAEKPQEAPRIPLKTRLFQPPENRLAVVKYLWLGRLLSY
jgi:hypothetical protein